MKKPLAEFENNLKQNDKYIGGKEIINEHS